jgi:diguanylate cyclase (GGDEF)-like protein
MANAKTRITAVKRIADSVVDGNECLVEIYGKSLGRKYDLQRPGVNLGRDPDNHIIIDTDSVSRRHARVESWENGWRLVDLNSTNGTYINDRVCESNRLDNGDLIKIGDTIFKFLSGKNVERSYHEEIYRLTIQDGLTQIANKRYLEEYLDKEFSRAKRYGRNLAVILLDVDHFKRINDTYGHLTGDFVLKELAQVVAKRIRREELYARYGGEEFVVVLPEASREGAREFAEMLRKLVAEHRFEFDGNVLPLTISIGIGHFEASLQTPDDLLRLADENLYLAKARGRNRVEG